MAKLFTSWPRKRVIGRDPMIPFSRMSPMTGRPLTRLYLLKVPPPLTRAMGWIPSLYGPLVVTCPNHNITRKQTGAKNGDWGKPYRYAY
jgi:hypothetical protein